MGKQDRKPKIAVLGWDRQEVVDAGGIAVQYHPTHEVVHNALRSGNIHGVLLTGGGDVTPELYTSAPEHKAVYGTSLQRDLVEVEAVDIAYSRGIPVLGICRGSQVMNVAAGGTLHQHIPDLDHVLHDHHHGGYHSVTTAQGSRLERAVGGRDGKLWVVSIHHQAVAELSDMFVPVAWSEDGVVEAIESVEGWMVGVQFHPEMDAKPGNRMQKLFNRFVRECARRAGLPAPRPFVPRPLPKAIRSRDDGPSARWDALRRKYERPVASVTVAWRCFRCRIDFDLETDHRDHMGFFHHVREEDSRLFSEEYELLELDE